MQDDWQDWLRRASQLRQGGRVTEAIDAYGRVLAINPALPNAWYNLGWLQKQARLFPQALESYRQALDRGIDEPEEVHLNRAVILSDHLHQPDAARAELDAALAKNPSYVPALINLGNIHEDLGDKDAARRAYSAAIATDSTNYLALSRLAGVSFTSKLDDELADRMRSALAQHDTAASDRADLGFALAGMLDAAGKYPEAFDAARAANADSRRAAGAVGRYDATTQERQIDRLISAFDRPVVAKKALPAPTFICGLFRSGSTLVEQILGAHSQVTTGGELDLVPALVARIGGYPETVSSADATMVEGWRNEYLAALPVGPGPGRLVTDKRPDNFLHIGLIKTLFPDAKIVHTHRNPLDNLLSLYFLHLDPGMSYALDLDDAAHWYGQYRRLMAHWKSLYPDDIHDVDYDALVRTPQPVIGSLLRFLGLGEEDGLLDFHRARGPVKTASVWQVRQPLHVRSSGRWRNYREQLKEFPTLWALRDRD